MAGYTIPDTGAVQTITELAGTAHTVFYADAAGNVTELALGASGEVLTSQGPASAPAFQAASAAASPIPLILALGG